LNMTFLNNFCNNTLFKSSKTCEQYVHELVLITIVNRPSDEEIDDKLKNMLINAANFDINLTYCTFKDDQTILEMIKGSSTKLSGQITHLKIKLKPRPLTIKTKLNNYIRFGELETVMSKLKDLQVIILIFLGILFKFITKIIQSNSLIRISTIFLSLRINL
jgi:hypothetical protein